MEFTYPWSDRRQLVVCNCSYAKLESNKRGKEGICTRVAEFLGAALLGLAAITFARTLNIPRLEALHGSDIVQLTACGGPFAVGLVGLLGAIWPGD
jgi:hypothetical protein